MFKIRVFDSKAKKWVASATGVNLNECERKLKEQGYEEDSRYLWLR